MLKMARKPQVVAPVESLVAAPQSLNPFAGLNLTTIGPKTKYGTRMTNEDRRAKLVTKLLHQKTVLTPGYTRGKTKSGKDRKEAWVNASPEGHSELELVPGLKGISVARVADIPCRY
jgi:hypothetical protein